MAYRTFFFALALIAASGCNLNKISNPPNLNESPTGAPKKSENNAEKHSSKKNIVGLPKQQQEARQQAGEVGPDAALPMKKEQFQFGPSAGATKNGTEQPFADAAGEVFVKPDGPMSVRQLPSSKRQED